MRHQPAATRQLNISKKKKKKLADAPKRSAYGAPADDTDFRKTYDLDEYAARGREREAREKAEAKARYEARLSGKKHPAATLTGSETFATARRTTLDVASQVGKKQLVPAGAGVGRRGRGAGFYCEACDLTFKDNKQLVEHYNSTQHLIKTGHKPHVQRATAAEVRARIDTLVARREELKREDTIDLGHRLRLRQEEQRREDEDKRRRRREDAEARKRLRDEEKRAKAEYGDDVRIEGEHDEDDMMAQLGISGFGGSKKKAIFDTFVLFPPKAANDALPDITVKGLEVVRKASRVYLEAYTSVLLVDQSVLESYYGRPVIVADREMVESNSDEILRDAQTLDVAFLVVGDPFGATTHTDLVLRAKELSIAVRTVPNASILSGIGACGLQLYNFGQTVSMVFFTDSWKPTSFYDRIKENRSIGLHTLVLLDIKVKEASLENLARGRAIYEPPRYMTVGQCARQMLDVEADRREKVYGPDSLAIGAARVGSETEKFVAGTLEDLCTADQELGRPLHSLVLLGDRTHELEADFARQFALDKEKWARLCPS
ncbi:hypothetical protein L249_8885 [Ophiocordyceps polyrhachis-furcata BCC 54312]|uniref:diphthine methyl ester synthase n=1 Tax=Ophiocordyceps polyrhachis-furcata BCC 54312 TaxID=1330021 RepID=A0A367L1Q1_9HYPO|nr:hypothetical protein L249_8885 [Ophiocordyceps polyrhachis-furcata BCC 54312]